MKNWSDKDRELYDRITQSADPLYDTVLTDALYRMWSQKIKNTKIIERSIHSKWQKIYSEKGFNILERLKIAKERVAGGTRITSIKVLLTEDLISDTHLFFIFINPGTYQNILLNSRGQAGPPGLYLHYHVARNLHFYNTENPKSYTQAHIEPFVILCEIAGLKYKKEAKDKDNWRYKEARKSLNAQLQSLVEKGLLLRFEIDKVSAKSRTGEFINVSVWFTPPDEQETQAVEDFMSQRVKMWKEKMLRLYYRRTLVPGVQPWDPHLMDDTEILEKYSNQEYFDQWLANGGYDVEKKKEALNRAYAELFPNARQSPLRISSEIAAMAEAARQRLAQKNVGIIKIRKDLHVSKPKTNTAHETLLETFARAFKTAHKTDYVFSELSPSTQKKAEKLDLSLQQIYTFLTDDVFPKKEFSELIRRINDVTAKASLLYKTSLIRIL